MTEQKHKFEFPNVANHPELEKLREMKEQKMDEWDAGAEPEEKPDPEDVKKDRDEQIAQRLRNKGETLESIGETLGYSPSWVSRHTTNPAKSEAV